MSYIQRFSGLSKAPVWAVILLLSLALSATAQTSTTTTQQQSSTTPDQKSADKQKQETPAAGGPQGDVGPIAIPKKKPAEEKPVEKPAKVKNPEGLEDFSLRVDVPLVNVDVTVLTKDGQFIPNLKKDHFRILEDGVPQKISNFSLTEAPITAVLLVEFASNNGSFIYDMLNASYTFTSSLKKEDWVALISYDMKPRIEVDFTQDKRAVLGALNGMRVPGFSETNMFDALYDTLDRLDGIEGRKYVVLISTGLDTFSRLTYDKILNKVKNTRDVTIYAVGTGQALREWADAHGYLGSIARLDFLQADNEMRTFANLTGGHAYFPRFEGEMPEIFRDIAGNIRNQYAISFRSSNTKQDGSYRKLKVELIDPATGQPLKIVDEKGKALKYQVIAREGYRAKQMVE
jgi:VWFA-related protein